MGFTSTVWSLFFYELEQTEIPIYMIFFGSYNGVIWTARKDEVIAAKTKVRWEYVMLDFVVRCLVSFHSVHWTWIGNQSWAEVWEFPVLWHYDGISVHKWCPPSA